MAGDLTGSLNANRNIVPLSNWSNGNNRHQAKCVRTHRFFDDFVSKKEGKFVNINVFCYFCGEIVSLSADEAI